MKIGGVEVNGPAEEVLVLPRSNGPDIVFTAVAVQNLSGFNQFVPEPVAKTAWSKEKGNHKLIDDPDYREQMDRYHKLNFAYMALKSLEPSEIEWSTVDMSKPDTWDNWEQEFKDAGFTDIEVRRIVGLVMSANSLDDNKLKQAREAFLQGRAEAAQGDPSGQEDVPPSTASGTPANDSE